MTQHLPDTLTALYGSSLKDRFYKLAEEYNELCQAAKEIIVENRFDEAKREDIIDELADVNIVLCHIAHLFGTSQEELLAQAWDKIQQRQTNPNYKRKHPHKES